MRPRLSVRLLASTLLAAVLAAGPALAQTKELLTIDLPGDPATLDPHLQWNTDSYSVYRNIFILTVYKEYTKQ